MSKKTSLLKLDQQLCFAVYSASLGFNKVYRKLLKDIGLTYSQYLVMMVLWEKEDVTVSEIGERMFLNSATLTPLLKRLEASKLITKTRSVHDERHVHISLTKKGKEMKSRAEKIPIDLGCALDMSPAELGDLKNKMNDLRDTLMKA